MAEFHSNGAAKPFFREVELEADRLAVMVRQLLAECERLQNDLSSAESIRDCYKQVIYDQMRGSFDEFRDVDIPDLETISAGPAEMI